MMISNANTEPTRPDQEPQRPAPVPGTTPEKQETGGAGVEVNPGKLNDINFVAI